MQYAILVTPTGGKLVTITEMQALGEEVARGFDYQCPDDFCRITVYPSFPEKKKPGRAKAPRPYFSARPKGSSRKEDSAPPQSHKEFCQRDGSLVARDKLAGMVKTRTFTPEVEAELADFPQLFDEREYRETQKKGNDIDTEHETAAPNEGEKNRRRSSGQSSPKSRESVQGSKLLRKFVRAYELLPEFRRQLPIRIRNSSARNYEEAFWHVAEAVDKNGEPAGRRIYYGRFYSYHLTPSGGVVVYFKGFSGNGKPLGVWVPEWLEPQSIGNEMMERLDRARKEPSGEQTAWVYTLGEFQLFENQQSKNQKYSIDLEKLVHFWVSFPNDYDQQP